MQATCTKNEYLKLCRHSGLAINWPDEPLSFSERTTLFHSKYLDLTIQELNDHIDNLNIQGTGNILLAGFGTGEDIERLLSRLDRSRKLFVIEPSRDSWAAAMSRPETARWPIGEQLFTFLDFESLKSFLQKNTDLMIPERIISFIHNEKTAEEFQPNLLALAHEVEHNFQIKKSEYTRFLEAHRGKRSYAALLPESSRDQLVLTEALHQIQESGLSATLLNRNFSPRQLTPLWILEKLLQNKVTDFIAINTGRHDLDSLLPSTCRFTTLVSHPVPELMEPGRRVATYEEDRVWPLNQATQKLLATRQHPAGDVLLFSHPQQIKPFHERTIDFLYLGDAPQFTFLHSLLTHPKLGELTASLQNALEKAPAYINRKDLDLIFALCERQSHCPLTIYEQREWLLELIHEHIVSAQNRRKTLLDLVSHQPQIKLKILGKDWEKEELLKPYLLPSSLDPRDVLQNAKVFIEAEGIPGKELNPLSIMAIQSGCCLLCAQPQAQSIENLLSPTEDYLSFSHLGELEHLTRTLAENMTQAETASENARKKIQTIDNSINWD